MNGTLASRNTDERKDGMMHDKIQRFSDGYNQGYNTTKVGKGKEQSIESDELNKEDKNYSSVRTGS